MSKIVTTSKLNRLWKNGILPIKNLVSDVNINRFQGKTYASLEEFVTDITNNPRYMPSMMNIKDSGGWGPLGTTNIWYRCILAPSQPYIEGMQHTVGVVGFMMTEDKNAYQVYIGGTKDAGNLTATYKNLSNAANLSMVSSYNDLMANTVAGYHTDALAVKQGFQQVNDSLGNQPQFVYDESGKITGYTTKIGGADSVFPFSGSGGGSEIEVLTFTTSHNTGANETGVWTATKTISTGLDPSKIIHATAKISGSSTATPYANVTSIADNGDITISIGGGNGSGYVESYFRVMSITLEVVLYKYANPPEREYTILNSSASSTFSGSYPISYATNGAAANVWLAANTDSAPYAVFNFNSRFVLKKISAIFCNPYSANREGYKVSIWGRNSTSEGWTALLTVTDVTTVGYTTAANASMTDYSIDNYTPYNSYMVNFDQAYAGIAEIDFFGTPW